MRDQRKRNRNIGTPKQGHGSNNRLVIPDRWSDHSIYWEKLNNPVVITRTVQGHQLTFLVEPPRSGYAYYCTVDDVIEVLNLLPLKHVNKINLIVFRQPTKKQSILSPVWGRLAYWSDILSYSGPGVYLESQLKNGIGRYELSVKPDKAKELDRLRMDGHRLERRKREYIMYSTPSSIRATQLYRTLPHEIGHYVDYMSCMEQFQCGDDWERFWQLYGAKPSQDKEAFAHRYADEFKAAMITQGKVPFNVKYDPNSMNADGIDPEWFVCDELQGET